MDDVRAESPTGMDGVEEISSYASHQPHEALADVHMLDPTPSFQGMSETPDNETDNVYDTDDVPVLPPSEPIPSALSMPLILETSVQATNTVTKQQKTCLLHEWDIHGSYTSLRSMGEEAAATTALNASKRRPTHQFFTADNGLQRTFKHHELEAYYRSNDFIHLIPWYHPPDESLTTLQTKLRAFNEEHEVL